MSLWIEYGDTESRICRQDLRKIMDFFVKARTSSVSYKTFQILEIVREKADPEMYFLKRFEENVYSEI